MDTIVNHIPANGYILAVEDSVVQAKKLEYIFTKNELPFVICSNAGDALIKVAESYPSIIVSDIIMPEMDGYELCKLLKNNPSTKPIPVILLTSLQDPHDIIRGLQAGADGFISKPYDEQFLLSRIIHLLKNNPYQPASSNEDTVLLTLDQTNYEINADKKQIINLLLSVYESAILRNSELMVAKTQLETMNKTLQEANDNLAAFAHMVSHDLKNPLNAIMGFSEMLVKTERCQLCNTEYYYMDIINKSSNNMLQLINDLLSFAKSGISELLKTDINISQIANNVVDDIKLRNKEYNAEVSIEEDIHAYADTNLIRIVLDNLLGNAFKYSQKSENPQIKIGKKEQFGQTVYYVSDNGVGFDMSKSEKLFQPFQRMHENKEFKGTGVGLSTVKKIIERHGGTIWAESEVGNGAEFFFTLS